MNSPSAEPLDPTAPVGHISMVLPGESISKFRPHTESNEGAAPESASHSHESHEAGDPFNVAPPPESAEAPAPHDEHEHQPPRDYDPNQAPRRFDRGGDRGGSRGPRGERGDRGGRGG